MTEKLPTRLELMAELETDAESILKHFGECEIIENIANKNLHLAIRNVDSLDYIDGERFSYRSDPVAPPVDGRAVIVGRLGKIRVSKGTFSSDGALQTYKDKRYGYHGCDDEWSDWCDFLNRDHHSEGWRREWEPDNE